LQGRAPLSICNVSEAVSLEHCVLGPRSSPFRAQGPSSAGRRSPSSGTRRQSSSSTRAQSAGAQPNGRLQHRTLSAGTLHSSLPLNLDYPYHKQGSIGALYHIPAALQRQPASPPAQVGRSFEKSMLTVQPARLRVGQSYIDAAVEADLQCSKRSVRMSAQPWVGGAPPATPERRSTGGLVSSASASHPFAGVKLVDSVRNGLRRSTGSVRERYGASGDAEHSVQGEPLNALKARTQLRASDRSGIDAWASGTNRPGTPQLSWSFSAGKAGMLTPCARTPTADARCGDKERARTPLEHGERVSSELSVEDARLSVGSQSTVSSLDGGTAFDLDALRGSDSHVGVKQGNSRPAKSRLQPERGPFTVPDAAPESAPAVKPQSRSGTRRRSKSPTRTAPEVDAGTRKPKVVNRGDNGVCGEQPETQCAWELQRECRLFALDLGIEHSWLADLAERGY